MSVPSLKPQSQDVNPLMDLMQKNVSGKILLSDGRVVEAADFYVQVCLTVSACSKELQNTRVQMKQALAERDLALQALKANQQQLNSALQSLRIAKGQLRSIENGASGAQVQMDRLEKIVQKAIL